MYEYFYCLFRSRDVLTLVNIVVRWYRITNWDNKHNCRTNELDTKRNISTKYVYKNSEDTNMF